MERLKRIDELSTSAANVVKEPIDKLHATTMKLSAVYHRQAFLKMAEGVAESECWLSGK